MMKNSFPCFLLLLSLQFVCQAQDIPNWEFQFSNPIQWSLRDNKAKLFLVYGKQTLSGYDYQSQKLLWEMKISGLDQKDVSQIEGFPYIQFITENLFKVKTYILINYLTGELLANTKALEDFKVIDIYPIYDANRLILKGRKEKERVYAMLHFGDIQPIWVKELPVELKQISFRTDFTLDPILVGDHLIYGFTDTLWAVKQRDGLIDWKMAYSDLHLHSIYQKPFFFRTKDTSFYLVSKEDGQVTLNAINPANKKPHWDGDLSISSNFKLTPQQEYLLYRDEHSFNHILYSNGSRIWDSPPIFTEKIIKIYQKEDGYLVLLQDAQGQYLNWVDNQGKKQFESSVGIKGGILRMAEHVDNQLIYLTEIEAGAIDLKNGQVLSNSPELFPNLLYTFHPERSAFAFGSGTAVWIYNYSANTFEILNSQIKFKDKEEYITAIRAIPNGWAVLSERNFYRLNEVGEILEHQFYKPESSFNFKKLVLVVGGLVAGAVFPDEMMEINRALHAEEIIDSDQAWNNTMARAAYGDVGSGLVGSNFGGSAYEALYGNKEEKIAASNFLNNKWILADKLQKGQFGLRIINTETGQEQKRIWLNSKSEFQYDLAPEMRGFFIIRNGNSLQFYTLD